MLPLATPAHPASASNLDPPPSAQLLFLGAFPHRGFCYFAGVVPQLLLVGAFPTGVFSYFAGVVPWRFSPQGFLLFCLCLASCQLSVCPFQIPVVAARFAVTGGFCSSRLILQCLRFLFLFRNHVAAHDLPALSRA